MEENDIKLNDNDMSNISVKNINAPPLAFENMININNNKDDNDSKKNFIIQISPFYIDKLKREHSLYRNN